MTSEFQQKRYIYVAVSVVTDTRTERQTDRYTHRTTNVTLAYAPRVKYYQYYAIRSGFHFI